MAVHVIINSEKLLLTDSYSPVGAFLHKIRYQCLSFINTIFSLPAIARFLLINKTNYLYCFT